MLNLKLVIEIVALECSPARICFYNRILLLTLLVISTGVEHSQDIKAGLVLISISDKQHKGKFKVALREFPNFLAFILNFKLQI